EVLFDISRSLLGIDTWGMFSTDSYSTVRGVDKLIPVDVYLPGCPPKPEAIIDAITKLRKKIFCYDLFRYLRFKQIWKYAISVIPNTFIHTDSNRI
ncbi:hypothetical protein R6Q59_015855, partial [Mikania micrantha]